MMRSILTNRKARLILASVLLLVAMSMPGSVLAGHGGPGGPNSTELTVVGQLDIAIGAGHISDVWAFDNYAYLGSFFAPVCSLDFTGVHILDISDPSNPTKVGFIPSPPGTRANDVKVEHIETAFFTGEILVFSNEPCFLGFLPRLDAFGGFPNNAVDIPGQDGVAIYDVTDPLNPKVLRLNFLDFPVHNTFIYQQGDDAFMLVVDDVNERDVHIVDITKPHDPRVIAVTGEPDWPLLETIPNGDSFVHDVWAQENDGKVTAYLSYWDSGLVLLDITDPANPIFLGDSVYADPDPLSGEAPEGNSHVAVPSADGQLVFMGDEDFAPAGLIFEFADTSFPAAEAAFTKPISSLPGRVFTGRVVWTGGEGCALSDVPDAPSSDSIALIQRGTCLFLTKGQNAEAKGYAGFVVANDAARGDALITMIASGGETVDVPGVFVGFSTGEAMKDAVGGAIGVPGGTLFALSFFDGWGYGRILDVSDPTNIVELGQFATENVLAEPVPPGDRTMHNVIVRDRRAYISWYAEGMRVVDFRNARNPREIAHFVAPGGSNFWGVFLLDHPDGNTYILGSDRDSGLWIFEVP